MSEGKKKLSYQERAALAAEIADILTARAMDDIYIVLSLVANLVSSGSFRITSD